MTDLAQTNCLAGTTTKNLDALRLADLDYLIELRLPLIALAYREKVPVEPWQGAERRDRKQIHFKGKNWAVKLGTKWQGTNLYLCAIDVDPRNGGLESLKLLEMTYGSLRGTLQVLTGSDGYHFYFLVDRLYSKRLLAPGVEFLCNGQYVVGPGSVHPNGKPYTFITQDEPVNLPDWVVENLTQPEGKAWLDTKKDGKEMPEVVPIGGRDNWLTSKAGQLRRSGLEPKEIFDALVSLNQRLCETPLPEADLKRIAKSVGRYEPGETIESPPIVTKEIPKAEPKVKVTGSVKELVEVYRQCDGLVKGIADEILGASKRPYEHFALAAAFAVIGGIAQGSFLLPNLYDHNKPDGSLSLFQWLVAPAGSGKNSYLRGVDTYLTTVDKRLVCDNIGSSYGLRGSLFCHNAVVSIIDEMQDVMLKFANRNNPHVAQVLTDMKELFNDLEWLRPVLTRGAVFPGIRSPRLSIFSVGTPGGFKKHLTGDLIGGGLLSRFVHWPEGPISGFNHKACEGVAVPHEHVTQLMTIFKAGLTSEGMKYSYEDNINRLLALGQKDAKVVAHEPQAFPQRILGLEPDAAEALIAFRTKQDAVYMKLVAAKMADDEVSPASMVARSPQVARKLAAIHCLGRGSNVISVKDAWVGNQIAEILTAHLSDEIMANSVHANDNEGRWQRVIKFLHRHPDATRKAMLQNLKWKGKELNDLLVDMLSSGQIVGRLADGSFLTGQNKTIPDGVKFAINPT